MQHNPLRSHWLAGPGDAIRFLEGSLDDELIEDLLFALTLVNWKNAPPPCGRTSDDIGIWPVYGLLKHLFLGGPMRLGEEQIYLAADLNVLAALRAGGVARAAAIAVRRLENAGLLPPDTPFAGGFEGTRLAAALLIPVPYTKTMKDLVQTGEMK